MTIGKGLAAVIAIMLVEAPTVFAGVTAGIPQPCGVGGFVFETSPFRRNTNVIYGVNLTNNLQQNIGLLGTVKARSGVAVPVRVPGVFNGVAVCDVRNTTRFVKPPDVGEIADLSIESLVLNTTTDMVEVDGLFATLKSMGAPVVRIPDLYADTNGDGILDQGDLLYSLVDIRQYIPSSSSFSLGASFSIVNGEVSSLPGMLFSTTPFVFDPTSPTERILLLSLALASPKANISSLSSPNPPPRPSLLLALLAYSATAGARGRGRPTNVSTRRKRGAASVSFASSWSAPPIERASGAIGCSVRCSERPCPGARRCLTPRRPPGKGIPKQLSPLPMP